MMDYFIFGDIDSRDYNVWLFDLNTDEAPESLMTEIKVPGRNGALLQSNRTFENMQHRYMGVIYENAADNLEWFRNAMMENLGYAKLEDSIHPEEFYVARYVGGLEPKLSPDRQMVKFAIEFSRKPQRFLASGEEEVIVPNGGTIENPTLFDSHPEITVKGYGTLSINGNSVTIENYSRSEITIDSEMMDCYYEDYNLNQYVTFSNNRFPVLRKGTNGINYSGNITEVRIVPRWWQI